ncbi:MAG: DNA translocase FtsK 4TM domain-containing protein [Planctomycetota bacterium]|nr:DNA translocase FtsK 4TM domain-containing protein [Planctomycetota bacterium]
MAKKKSKKKAQSEGVLDRVKAWFTPAEKPVRAKKGEEEVSEHLQEIKGLLLIGFALFLFVSMISFYKPINGAEGKNWGGQAGYYLAAQAFAAVGWSGYMLCFLAGTWGMLITTRKQLTLPVLRVFGGLCFLISSAYLFQLAFGAEYGVSSVSPYGPGGYLALETTSGLVDKFGGPGLWLVLSLVSLVSFMLATEMAFLPAIGAMRDWFAERASTSGEGPVKALGVWLKGLFLGLWNFVRGADLAEGQAKKPAKKKAAAKKPAKKKPAKKAAPVEELYEEEEEEELEDDEEWEYEEVDEDEEEPEDDEEEWEYEDEEDEEEEEEEVVVTPAKVARKKPDLSASTTTSIRDLEPVTPPAGPWKLPPLTLLNESVAGTSASEKDLEEAATKLENALASFKVDAHVVGARVGPAITLFELEVAQGTRMNKVTQLSQEIAGALLAKSVRIIAPIPGRSTIGIEIPNKQRATVTLRSLVRQEAYDKRKYALPLFLGMDAEGTPIVADLAKMPHLLIAGTTGSGKSVCINTILASMLLTRSPHEVQWVLIDPKMVELQMFTSVPHMMVPVVTDAKQATNVLLWACEKMEGRYELFKDAGVKNIKGYNALGEDKLREKLGEQFSEERTPRAVPYIVIVIDELADLMMVSKKEAEQAITRLAQKSRAVGIHVIVATQRPSTDVITGVLKGNLPTRIAFQVASKIDSRVILDTGGAEKLLGGGDMLYTPPGVSHVMRVQGAWATDEELQDIVDFVKQDSAASFNQELVQAATGTAKPGMPSDKDPSERDELWDEAVRVILKSKRGSASLLQRALGIGYTRGTRLLEMMEEEGIVGAHKGSKAREVNMSLKDWDALHGVTTGDGDE